MNATKHNISKKYNNCTLIFFFLGKKIEDLINHLTSNRKKKKNSNSLLTIDATYGYGLK